VVTVVDDAADIAVGSAVVDGASRGRVGSELLEEDASVAVIAQGAAAAEGGSVG
jgi:hypothetical protein